MAFGDVLCTLQIGDCSGYFLDLLDAAERELETENGLIKNALRFRIQEAVLLDLAIVELAVEGTLTAFHLPFVGIEHLFVQGFRGVRRFVVRADVLHLHVEIDPVEKGVGEAVSVALYLAFGTAAVLGRAQKVAAGAGVHRGDEEKGGWVLDLGIDAGDADLSVLQRFSERFENDLLKMGKFVEEEQTVMRETDLADLRFLTAAAEDRGGRRGVVG